MFLSFGGKETDSHIMKTKTICFFNSCKTWGGGEKWHYEMSVRLSKRGYNTIVITNKRSELYFKIRNEDLKLHNIKISNLSFLNIFKIIKIAGILKKEKVDTIIINLSADLKVAGLAAKLAGTKNIIYRRGSAIPVKNTFLNRFLFQYIITEIIANSEETKRTILKNNLNLIDENKISVIYNGIDIEKYDNFKSEIVYIKENNEIILGNAGRLVKQKGQRYLIEIAKKLSAKGGSASGGKEKQINFKLLIAGEGKLKNELEQYAKELGVEKEVVFLGFIENIKGFMETIDIFLHTSLWEGFGYVIVEAMASKKSVIAFNVSSNPEIIENNKTGFLIRDKDLDEFVEKIELLAGNIELRNKFGKNAREKVEAVFNIERSLQNVEKIIGN